MIELEDLTRLFLYYVKESAPEVFIKMDNHFNPEKHPRDEEGKFIDKNKGDNLKTESDVFGEPFKEFSNKPFDAINKLIEEKRGFVPSAISRKELGNIDFVYGEDGRFGYGLAHIIEKHGKDILKNIPNLIKYGDIDRRHEVFGRVYIQDKNKKIIIRLDWNKQKRNWLASAFNID
nr:MAG TPA: hypothetical protein [Caudoviricetes sp.]